MWKKIWNDPVWSKVIASAIIAGAGFGLVVATGWWPTVLSWIKSFVLFLSSPSAIPNWIIILTALFLLLALRLFIKHFVKSLATQYSWLAYTTDNFMGLRWRWRYIDNEISEPVVFCPHCDFQLIPKDISDFGPALTQFKCNNCNTSLQSIKHSYYEICQIVTRQIQLKIRNNSWSESSKT